MTPREAERSKNMFALGLMSWLYGRSIEATVAFLEEKFAKRPEIAAANMRALQAGYAFGETTETFAVTYEVKPAKLQPGTYRNITGNQALSLGLVAASRLSGLPLFLGAYPITPASSILHELAGYKNFGVRTFQAEDEIAAAGAALGAAFGGSLGVTTSAGPGDRAQGRDDRARGHARAAARHRRRPARRAVDGHADQDRAGRPAQALFGRNGESPVPVVAARSPADCFDAAIEACRIALKYRTPVFLLSDAYLANGSEPWRLPDVDVAAGHLDRRFATEPNAGDEFLPYLRDQETLARPWAVPGTPGLEHRIGGLEKADGTGNVSLRPGQPRPDDAAARAEGRRASPPTSRSSRWTTPTATRACSCSAGAARTARSPLPCRRVRRGGRQGRARAPAPPEPVPAQHRRGAVAATSACSCRR